MTEASKGVQSLALYQGPDLPDLSRFDDPFEEDEIEWKPIAISKKTQKALAAAYVTNRAVMERLDSVCGKDGWKNEFQRGPDGGVICGLSVWIRGQWVTKWDGAENTDIEAVKGGLSTSMRRAAVQWGIGRGLYSQPNQWLPIDEHGRFKTRPTLNAPRARKAKQAPPTTKPKKVNTSSVPAKASTGVLHAFFSKCGFTDEDRALRIDFACTLMDASFDSFSVLSDDGRVTLMKRATGCANYLGSPELLVQFAAWAREEGMFLSDPHVCKAAMDDFAKLMATALS